MPVALRIIAATLALLCSLPALGASVWDNVAAAYFPEDYQYDDLEGVWQFPDDGATLLIKRNSATAFAIILLDSPKFLVTEPTTIGKAIIAPEPHTYDAHLSRSAIGDRRLKDNDIKLSITATGMLSLTPYHQKMKLHLRRWLPYFFRVGVERGDMPDGLIGARRIFPLTTLNYKPAL